MDFESLKEQFSERLTLYKGQLQDSELYIRAKEKYDNLTPSLQKVVKYFGILMVVYFLYSIPASFVDSANEKLALFEDNRQLTRDLIRAGRIEKTVKLPPQAPSESALTQTIEGILTKEDVLPEQKMATTPKSDVASKQLVPKSIIQSGIKLSVKKLTLRQVVKIGESLNSINSSRLMNMAIQADSQDPHYYTVDYEVAAFEVPRDPVEIIDGSKRSKFKSRRNNSKKGKK